jgi:hypothetical protein
MFTNVSDRTKFNLEMSRKNEDPDWLKSNITLHDLVRSVGCDNVRDFIDNSSLRNCDLNYDINVDGYVEVFKVIHDLDIKGPDSDNKALVVLNLENKTTSYAIIDVYVFCFDNPDASYATYSVPWKEIASYYVLRENLAEFSINNFISYVLHNITFFGFSEENIKESENEILRRAEGPMEIVDIESLMNSWSTITEDDDS